MKLFKIFTTAIIALCATSAWAKAADANTAKSDIKDFYVFVPNNTTWKSATPKIYEVYGDGKTKDIEMTFDSDNCGWYYRRYIDETLPISVVIHRDDDEYREEAIGLNGTWEEGISATPIPLNDYMEALGDLNNTLYFVADEEEAAKLPSTPHGWYTTRPPAEGKCGYDLAAIIYDTDASLHGAFTCSPAWSREISDTEKEMYNACYYSSAKFPINSTGDAVVPCSGVTQGMVEKTLAFDPKTKKKYMVLTQKGKTCFGAQAEDAFKAMFNYTEGVNEQYCFNMPFTQTKDGKFEFDSDTYEGPEDAKYPAVGGFYPAENEPSATMMLSPRLPAAENKRLAEGPTFFCPDYNSKTTKTPEGLRTIHSTEGVPMSDLICNGGGWEGGIDCEGLFAGGHEFSMEGEMTAVGSKISKALGVTWAGDGWGWSCKEMAPIGWTFYKEGTEKVVGKLEEKGQIPTGGVYRWTSGSDPSEPLTKAGRNQHFCMESHATFRYKKNLKFSFRGDDDIWIFINNKLAVDLGGTHMPAPGYVDVDKFMADDEPQVGDSYPIDIYFCDRRTTASNIHINTNMFIEQKSGIEPLANQDKDDYFTNGNNHYLICFTESGDGSCAAASNTTAEATCGSNIKQEITYELTTDKTGEDPTKVVVSVEDFKASPKQYKGGIDVSKKGEPIINKDILKNYFAKGGTFYLLIHIGNQTRAVEIKISGSIGIGVADRGAVFVDENDNRSPNFKFKSQVMASSQDANGAYDSKQMAPLYIAAISDPCGGEIDCPEPLELSSAKGTSYTLSVSNTKAQFYEMKNGVLVPIDISQSRKIGEGGVDTVYATIPFDEMSKSVEPVNVNVTGSSRIASINFFVPTLKFVKDSVSTEQVSTDPDSYVRMKGQSYEFYIAAFNPDGTVCSDCNFSLIRSATLSSTGVDIISASDIVNGRATIWIRSSQTYLRNADGTGTANFAVLGPSTKLMSATYTNMQFQEPPVPTPQFADIFDVHGEKAAIENMPEPYFYENKEYLDGIGDSLVVYYHRLFNIDSLPFKITVYWSDDKKDSVVFDTSEIEKGVFCGSKYKWNGATLGKKECLNMISLGGKNLSKKVKTGGSGKVVSWKSYCPKFDADGVNCSVKPVVASYEGVIYDRIAPIIVSARSAIDGSNGIVQLKLTFSEKVKKTTQGVLEGDVFSYYINKGENSQYVDYIPLHTGITLPEKMNETHTLIFSQSSTYPQSGDYIHFRSLKGVGFVEDQSDYKAVDSLRKAWNPKDSTYNWNIAPGYDATKRLPSPWIQIGGYEINFNNSDIDFYVKMTGAFEFEIVLSESYSSLAKRYAVMDMNGQVISVGELNEKSARVKVPTAGAYVVKVNLNYKRVNVK